MSWEVVVPNIEPGTFGLAIAFLAPGVVGLWGIGQHVATVREWFGATANTTATGAGFLFVLLSSLAMGLFISGVRQEILDGLLFKRLGVERPDIDESKLTDPEVRSALRFASDNLYRYFQFYANMAFAIMFTYVAWLIHDWRWTWWRFGGLVLLLGALAALMMSALYSVKRYYGALRSIFALKGGTG